MGKCAEATNDSGSSDKRGKYHVRRKPIKVAKAAKTKEQKEKKKGSTWEKDGDRLTFSFEPLILQLLSRDVFEGEQTWHDNIRRQTSIHTFLCIA